MFHCRALSWFAVGCYYYCIKKYDQSRRYFRYKSLFSLRLNMPISFVEGTYQTSKGSFCLSFTFRTFSETGLSNAIASVDYCFHLALCVTDVNCQFLLFFVNVQVFQAFFIILLTKGFSTFKFRAQSINSAKLNHLISYYYLEVNLQDVPA